MQFNLLFHRFVRETGYATLTALIAFGCLAGENRDVAPASASLLTGLSAKGMADNWSQVRMAASVTARALLEALGQHADEHLALLLPPLCLNRYYMAEGVRIYNQETWKKLAGHRGKQLVEKYAAETVAYYARCAEADNHAVREAACHCIAELAVKLDKAAVEPYADQLLDVLLGCFRDESWPVRDSACGACGRFASAFPVSAARRLSDMTPLMEASLGDPIASVRQGAAAALTEVAVTFKEERLSASAALIKTRLAGLADQPSHTSQHNQMSSSPGQFGVVKWQRDNDAKRHENQQMYSCGSLAPKMGRRAGGGCSDARFNRPSEPWEYADGAVHLLAEVLGAAGEGRLSEDDVRVFTPLISEVADACRAHHYTQHLTLIETALRRTPDVARGAGKRGFKPHLEDLLEAAFYAYGSESQLAQSAAEDALRFLATFVGPSILRGRVDQAFPRHLAALEDLLEGSPVGGGGGAASGVAIPCARDPRDFPMPSLGGTPPI